MFDIGFGEMILLAVIALVAIGPKQLPEVARIVGRFLNEMKRMSGDFTKTIIETRDQANHMLNETSKLVNDSIEASMNKPVQPPLPEHSSAPLAAPAEADEQMSFNLASEASPPAMAPNHPVDNTVNSTSSQPPPERKDS